MKKFWDIAPGPNRFLGRIQADLQNGRSALIHLPAFVPRGFEDALRNRLVSAQVNYDWYAESTVEDGLTLLADGTTQRVSILDCRHSQDWQSTLRVLSEIVQRAKSSNTRGYEFCVLVNQDVTGVSLLDEALVRRYVWKNTVSRLDMLLYADAMTDRGDASWPERELFLACIVELAMWDPEVVDVFSNDSLETLIAYRDIRLQELGAKRGWIGAKYRVGEGWMRGIEEVWHNKMVVHSAFAATNGQEDILEDRIWMGQVGVLLPHLQICRQELVRYFSGDLRVGYKYPVKIDKLEKIRTMRDYEIGTLYGMIKSKEIEAGDELKAEIEGLKSARDKLCHGEMLEASVIEQRFTSSLLKRILASRQKE